jgi:2-dehydro-3-deoxygluconokinase
MSVEVIALGEPMVEFNATTVGRLREISSFERGWGGDTSNFVVAVARLGRRAGYICRVGDDEFGHCMLELWRREAVDTSQVIVEKGGITGIYFVSRRPDGEHDFTYYRKYSAASHLSPSDLDPNYIASARVLHASGITQAISQSCREATAEAIRVAEKGGLLVSYDPNIRLRLWSADEARRVVMETLGKVDIFLPSENDLAVIFGLKKPRSVVKLTKDYGIKATAVKMGERGCYVLDGEQYVFVPAMKSKFVDSTGAGDAFDAAFVVGILEGKNLLDAAKFANVAAALKCRGVGAVGPLPRRSEVMSFLNKKRENLINR